jgi:diadenosine tetraphosphate (Ap4A) HIT family hydrolase
MSCALCQWVREPLAHGAGERPVYEDDLAIVLVEGAPGRRGEALVIPKAHYRAVSELDERTGLHLLKLGMRAALSLGASAEDDVHVLLDSAQETADPHVHVRVRRSDRHRK